MKIRELIVDLVEAKFRKPHIMYHGTSTKFLRSILKNGIQPKPKEKTWADDPQQVIQSFSRASLEGSYWSGNLMTATSSASNTRRKYGGNDLLVIAQISEQSAYADEDLINFALLQSLNNTVADTHPGIRRDFHMILGHDLYDESKNKERVQKIFRDHLHELLGGSEKHEPNKEFFNELLDTLVKRNLAYERKSGMSLDRWVVNVPDLPTITDIEQHVNRLREQLTRSYRATALDRSQFSHNLRITLPVGFSGANKILQILEIPQWRWEDEGDDKKLKVDPFILLYGSKDLPSNFYNQYESRVGKFPGLMTPDGEILIPSRRES